MNRKILLIILYSLVFRELAFCNVSPRQEDDTASELQHGEYTFGIEFALDHILSSVTLENGSTYGLFKLTGDGAYQSLMRSYLETCHQSHLTQTPAPFSDELQQAWNRAFKMERKRKDQFIRKPEQSWWDWFKIRVFRQPLYSLEVFERDEFTGDIEVSVLTRAVTDLKDATMRQMSTQFNITESRDWAYASVIAPDFFWTTIEPQCLQITRSDSVVSSNESLNEEDLWLRHTLRKFSTALFRNKYRLQESCDWRVIISSSLRIYDISSTSLTLPYKAMHCVSREAPAGLSDLGLKPCTLSPASTVLDFRNASLSLWVKGPLWTPWNTFPELGGHSLASCRQRDFCVNAHWDATIAKLEVLTDSIDSRGKEAIDLVFTGESWTEASLALFRDRLQLQGMYEKMGIKNEIHQPDIFAASMRASRWGWYNLHDWYTNYQFFNHVSHDEL
jgi:hypothetical protein